MVIFMEALSIVTTHYGSVHKKVAISLHHVGMVLEKQGKLKDALRSFMAAHDIYTKLGVTENDSRGMCATIRGVNELQELMSVRNDNDNSLY